MNKNYIFLILVYLLLSNFSVRAANDGWIYENSCKYCGETETETQELYKTIETKQIDTQKRQASASDLIEGKTISADCLSNFDILSGGINFGLPNIDSLISGFIDKLCNFANSAIREASDGINKKLSNVAVSAEGYGFSAKGTPGRIVEKRKGSVGRITNFNKEVYGEEANKPINSKRKIFFEGNKFNLLKNKDSGSGTGPVDSSGGFYGN